MTNLLDLDELNRVQEPYSRAKNIDTYNYLLEQCHRKIKEFNKVHRSKCCYYKPPLLLNNRPMYNYFDLIDYLMDKLRRNGLYCEYVKTQGLYICWDPQLLNTVNYQNELNSQLAAHQEALSVNDQNQFVPAPKPKAKPKAKGKSGNRKTNTNKNQPPKMIDILKMEDNDEFPINIDAFR